MFFDNNRELEAYLAQQGLNVSGVLLAYHMAGASFLPDVRKYATKNADEYGHTGGGKALIESFTETFGEAFDGTVHTVTDYLAEGPATIGGIELIITVTPDAFDLEIPEINTVYTHMLGHDCHSIIAGAQHAEAMENSSRVIWKRLYAGFDLPLYAGGFKGCRNKACVSQKAGGNSRGLRQRRGIQNGRDEGIPQLRRGKLPRYDGRLFYG